MSEQHKKRVAAALNKYYEKQDKDTRKLNGLDSKPRQKNEQPEKEVEKACLKWMREQKWLVEIYEAKSTWSQSQQRWLNSAMKAGTSDCMGTLPEGIAVAVEFKAPGRLSSFNSEKRYLQRKFIVDRINSNTFACVVDSVDRLKLIYEKWRELRRDNVDFGVAREYLLSMLPIKKESPNGGESPLFDGE